ncbi:transglutaminaseTgpA domain-containing protein [Compostimonas suwonensis]|uniref:Transglutaminase-like putative cysteine protease n=1 Tax=Compostimonas suwonensis TaxID=1048394 RepID=A0A2M9BZZ1_9MICO|nr:DUF3488 and transglutaminase-like domain-containing protein [Compostimonas suwonensis]PJJ63657.1 transglutaminase-like putative cysteine protease [Compostimonas suwonensis]
MPVDSAPTSSRPVSRPVAATRSRRRARRPGYLPLSATVLLALMVADASLAPLLSGFGWWWSMSIAAAIVLFGTAALRWAGVPRGLLTLFTVVIGIVTLTLFFAADTALLGLVPTPGTLGRFGDLLNGGIQSIQSQSLPADAVTELSFVLTAGAVALAVVLDIVVFELRWPALAGVPLLIVVTIPGLLVPGGASLVLLALTAAVYAAILWVDGRIRRREAASAASTSGSAGAPGGATVRHGASGLPGARPDGGGSTAVSVGIAGVAIFASLAFTAVAPGFTAGGVTAAGSSGIIFSEGVSPLIDLGQDLRRPAPVTAMAYTTEPDERLYFKLLTLDEFGGTTWTSSEHELDEDNTPDEFGDPPGLGADVATREVSTDVDIRNMQSPWLPLPYPTVSVNGLSGRWYWEPQGLTATSPTVSTRYQNYTVDSLVVDPTREQLAAAGDSVPADIERYLELPELPQTITDAAAEATAGAFSNYDKALALQQYFRGGDFFYSTETPVEEGYDGDGIGVIQTFLERKTGYCVHFASAMTIMARSLGIPARIGLGYLPGTRTGTTDDDRATYTVSSYDLHSWPELYFDGVGWVSFEPTPGRGFVPSYARPEAQPSTTPTPTDASTPRPSDASTNAPQRPDAGGGMDGGAGGETAAVGRSFGWAGIGLGVLALLLAPAVVRSLRRSRRFARIRAGSGGASLAWIEIGDTALDHGIPVDRGETPRAFATRLSTIDPTVNPALWHVLSEVERERFGAAALPGRTDAERIETELRTVLDHLDRSVPMGRRLLARFVPRSLLPSVAARPGDPATTP